MKNLNLSKSAIILLVALVSGFFLQSCDNKKAPTQTELEGIWVLKTINGEKSSEAFKGAIPTLTFNFQDSIISGNAGCNNYSGVFSYDKGSLLAPNLIATTMLCLEENKEADFLKELRNTGNTLSIENGILKISHDGKVVLEFSAAPIDTIPLIKAEDLNGEWTLKLLNGEDATSKFKNGDVPVLTLNSEDSKIGGFSGCNRYNGNYSFNEGKLLVGELMLTRMSCPDMFYENEYIKALSDTSVVSELNEGVLKLSKNGKDVLEFVKGENVTAVTDSLPTPAK